MLWCSQCDAKQFHQVREGFVRVVENPKQTGSSMRKLGYTPSTDERSDGIYCINGHPIPVPDHVSKHLGLNDAPPLRATKIDLQALVRETKQTVKDATITEYWLQKSPHPPTFADPKRLQGRLNKTLCARLKDGIGVDTERLYSHQADAIEHVLSGEHVVIQTPTASGKSICYLAPVFHALLADKNATAMFVFPTKALSFDQIGKIMHMGEKQTIGGMPGDQSIFPISLGKQTIHCARWDSNVAYHDQSEIKEKARILITNPDALHSKLLGHIKTKTGSWQPFLRNISHVVLDEIHEYRGVFGANVALLLRRLRMLCDKLGNRSLQFICCSATLPNPKEHAEELVGLPFEVVTTSGAPSYPKVFCLWNPGFQEKSETERREPSTDAVEVLSKAILKPKAPVQTITFIQSLGGVERFNKVLSGALKRNRNPHAEHTATYTSRAIHENRVEIQSKLFSREIMHVTATRALELGIDIGDLNCCFMLGYPGSVASTLQEAGRVGRGADSLVVLMLRNDPYEQFFARDPAAFFELLKTSEAPKVPIDNTYLLANHIMCANWEAVSVVGGYAEAKFLEFFPPKVKKVLKDLNAEGKITTIRGDKGQMFWRYKKGGPPYTKIYQSIRVPISVGKFKVVERHNKIEVGECDSYLVPRDLHPGAVWLNNG